MKTAKYCVSVVMIIIFLTLTLMSNFAYIALYEANDTIRIEAEGKTDINVIIEYAQKHNLTIYKTATLNTSLNKKIMMYFVPDNDYTSVEKANGIPLGIYKSPVLGSLEVRSNYLDQLDTERYDNVYNIQNASQDDIIAFSDDIFNEGYIALPSNSYGHIYISQCVPYIIFFFTCLVIILMTYMEASFKKKELLIRYILGDSFSKHIVSGIISDVLFYAVVFSAGFIILNRYTAVCNIYNALIFWVIPFIVLNAFVSVSVIRFNSREIVYGHQYSGKMIKTLKFLKTLSTIMVFGAISIIITILPESKGYKKTEKILGDKMSYVFADFSSPPLNMIKDPIKYKTQAYYYQRKADKMLKETDELLAPVYMYDLSEFDDKFENTICCNFRALEYLRTIYPEIRDLDPGTSEFVLLLPSDIASSKASELNNGLSEFFLTIEGFEADNSQIIYYDSPREVLAFTSAHDFDFYLSPYIYITGNTFLSEKYTSEKANHHYYLGNAIFKNPENLNDICSEYGFDVVYSTVSETYNEKYEFYKTLMAVSGIASILIFSFYITITSILVKLSYKINSVELALKKILGYSMTQKNSDFFRLVIVAFVCNIVLACFIILIFKAKVILLLVPIIITLTDVVITISNITTTEKKSLIKILKGGAL